eukprot:PhF_6_TR40478/c0_g2_i1/m.60519
MIAFGFSQHPQSYLRQTPWNIFDFTLVVVSVVITSLTLSGQETGNLKILRILRTVRPLRFIRQSPGLRIVFNAFTYSLVQLKNICFFIGGVWLVFAIMGVQLFKGKFWVCTDRTIMSQHQCEAMGHFWDTAPSHFDHVPAAFQTLFELATMDGWIIVNYMIIDTKSETELERNNSPLYSIYILCFIVVGCFFMVNLFVGALIDTFDKEKGANKSIALTAEQASWVEAHKRLIRGAPEVLHHTTQQTTPVMFTYFINACIILNILVMCTEHYPSNKSYDTMLDVTNALFVLIFLVEVIVKINIEGGHVYLQSRWNKFDLTITILSVMGVFLDFILTNSDGPGGGLSALRIIRVLRILRMVKSAQSIHSLLKTLILSLPSLGNIAGIVALIFFIFAVIGMNAFGTIHRDEFSYELNRNANFETFRNSFLLLIRVVTGDGWTGMLYDCRMTDTQRCSDKLSSCGSKWGAVLYFDALIVMCMYMLLNLFIAVIMDSFETIVTLEVPITDEDVELFYKTWHHYDRNMDYKMHADDLVAFLQELGERTPLGFPKDCKTWSQQMIFIRGMDMPLSEDGTVELEMMLGRLVQAMLVYNGRGALISKRLLAEMEKKQKKKRRERTRHLRTKQKHVEQQGTKEMLSERVAVLRIQYWYRRWRKHRQTRMALAAMLETHTEKPVIVPPSPKARMLASIPCKAQVMRDRDLIERFMKNRFPLWRSAEARGEVNPLDVTTVDDENIRDFMQQLYQNYETH